MPRLRSLPAWSFLFTRSAPEFTSQTPLRIAGDLRDAVQDPARVGAWFGAAGPRFWLLLAVLALCLGLGRTVERARRRSWRRVWTGLRAWRRRDRVWRLLVRVAERAALPLASVVLWSFGAELAGLEVAFLDAVQGLLAIWTAFRLIEGTARYLLFGGPAAERPESAFPPLRRLLAIAAVWAGGWWLLDALDYRPDALALWITLGHLVLVLGVFRLLVRKAAVLALLPEFPNPWYQAFQRALASAYLPLVWGSLAVALLWVAGYANLAQVVLGRGWAVVGLGLGAALAQHAMGKGLEGWVRPEGDREEERAALIGAGHRLVTLVLGILVLSLLLRTLELRDPLLAFLDRPWFPLAKAEVSGRMLWRSVLLGVFALLGSAWLQALLAFRVYPNVGVGPGEAYAFNRLLHYALLGVTVLLVLNNLGLSPESLAIVLGGLSVGLGFGLQNIANNIASGLILLTSRQVRRGDLITVGDQTGTVCEVNLRSTVLSTPDNVELIIPNSKLIAETLVNWTHSSTIVRGKVAFAASPNADPGAVMARALEIARQHPEVLPEPAPTALLLRSGDHGLEFEMFVFVDLAVSARPMVVSDLYCRLLPALREAGFEAPHPQRDLHLRSGPWDRLPGAEPAGEPGDGRTA